MSFTIHPSAGVYIKEFDLSRRVRAISSSVGAIVGASNRGPVGQRTLVTSNQEFQALFGFPNAQVSFLHYAAEAYLRRSDRLYITRAVRDALYGGVVVSKDASNQLVTPNAPVGTGNNTGTLPDGTYSYKVSAVDNVGQTIASVAGPVTINGATPAEIIVNSPPANSDVTFTAVVGGPSGNAITIEFINAGASQTLSTAVVGDAITVTLGTDAGSVITSTAGDVALEINTDPVANLLVSAVAEGTGLGLVTVAAVQNLQGGQDDQAVVLTWTAVTGATSYNVYGRIGGSEGLLGNSLTTTFTDSGIVVPGVIPPTVNTTNVLAIKPFAVGHADPATDYVFGPNDLFIIYANNPGTWDNGLRIAIDRVNGYSGPGTFRIGIYEGASTLPSEFWDVSREDYIDGYGRQLQLEERINSLSTLIKVRNNAVYTAVAAVNQTIPGQVNMVGGSNGSAITSGDIMLGWELYRDPEQVFVDTLINGGYSVPEVQYKMDEIAQARRSFAILDMPSLSQQVQSAIDYRRITLNLNSSYSAIYSADVRIVDPYNDLNILVPPSGHVAAAYAYTDATRQLWFAPAGMDRGAMPEVLGARYAYNQGQRDALDENQINVIRTIYGRGIRIWGAETLQASASALSWVNVRRLLNHIENAVSEFLLFAVFDPNDQFLRDQIVGSIIEFLTPIRTGRGLYEFDVVSDASNNPPNEIDEGNLHVDVYLKPVIPAKRIILSAIITKTGAEFKELIVAGGSLALG